MADNKENIEYSPEELAEIERIVSILPGSESEETPPEETPPPVEEPAEDAGFIDDIPDDLDLDDLSSSFEATPPAAEEVSPGADSFEVGDDAFAEMDLDIPDLDIGTPIGEEAGFAEVPETATEPDGGMELPDLDLGTPTENEAGFDEIPEVAAEPQGEMELPDLDFGASIGEGSGFDEIPDVSAGTEDESELPELDNLNILDEGAAELPDITDSITEIEEPEEEDVDFGAPLESGADDVVDLDLGLDLDMPAETAPITEGASPLESEFDLGDDFGGADLNLPPIEGLDGEGPDEAEVTVPTTPAARPGSTMGQLNELLEGEPESVDADEISTDAFIGGEDEDFAEEEAPVEEDSGVSIDGQAGLDDLPDLSSIDLDSSPVEMSEGDISDLPDVDLGDMSGDMSGGMEDMDHGEPSIGDSEGLSDLASELGDFDADSFGEIEDIQDIGVESPAAEPEAPSMPDVADFDDDFGSMGDLDDLEDLDHSISAGADELPDISADMPEIEMVDELGASSEESMASAPADANAPLELSADELKKIKKALLLYPAGLTDAIKDAILNDRLMQNETRRLVDMILQGRPEDNVHRFLEKKLREKIDKNKGEGGGRRVVLARPEYSTEGRQRQKVLLRRTRNIALGAFAAIVVLVFSYNVFYKPMKAKKLIDKGVKIVYQFNETKFNDYQEAEELFTKVNEKLVKDYLYGYNRYALSYMDQKEYLKALKKLNEAYVIASDKNFSNTPADWLKGNREDPVEVLNNLGHFYSQKKDVRFNDFFEKSVKLNLNEYYFDRHKALGPINTQYDLALDFYKKALNKDPKNVNTLLGIGDVYMNQEQFLKARTYYENILKINKNSIAGLSGLLNLFILQDNFPETVKVYVKLRDDKMLEDISSPLLSNLAGYFLSKSLTDSQNIRVDYGIQSPRLKDEGDQPYPALVTVLKALRKRDPDYPQLYIQYAKLSFKQQNYKLAKEYLENGLSRAEKQGFTFFAGKHMMGEYCYFTRQPDKAYKYFKEAMADYNNPPEYAFHNYYRETENIGDTYTMLGNVFYYFFDKVKFRSGDQEHLSEVEIRKNAEMLENFNIAKKYYERALAENYETPELHYNLGRIDYLNQEYTQARDQWLNLYDEFTVSPELMIGLGNVFYKTGNYEAAKAQYMKLINFYEYESEKIQSPQPSNAEHRKIFTSLSSAYNNIGAVYQKQEEGEKSAISYWHAIEYSRSIGQESEFARVNINKVDHKKDQPDDPILDDNIPYSIDYYKEDMRWSNQ